MEEITFGQWLARAFGYAWIALLVLGFIVAFVMSVYSIWYQKTKSCRALKSVIQTRGTNLASLRREFEDKLSQAKQENNRKQMREALEALKFIHNAERVIAGKGIKRR